MKLECRQEHLVKALQLVSRMVGTRGTLPVLGNILLSTEKGRLKLAATDLEIGVQTWVGSKVEADGAITVPARLLVDFVATNNDETIRLSCEDTTLHLESAHYKANIKGIEASEFPLIPEIKKDNPLIVSARDLKEAITQTVFAAAIDETRPVLTGVFFKVVEDSLRLAATDSYRLAERRLPLAKKHDPVAVVVPARTLQEVARILGDGMADIEMAIAENQIAFTLGETQLISRLIDGTFPDYEQIIPQTTLTELTLQKGAFSQVMKMASFFARESANNVQVTVKDGDGVEVTAVSPQLGDTVSDLPAEVKGDAVEIAFNAKFILDALTIFPGDKLRLGLSGKLQPGVLRPLDEKQYLYLIMPLRVDA